MAIQISKEKVIKYMYKHYMSCSDFCNASGITRYTLKRILDNKPINSADNIQKLTKFFNTSVSSLIEPKEIIEEVEKNVFRKKRTNNIDLSKKE